MTKLDTVIDLAGEVKDCRIRLKELESRLGRLIIQDASIAPVKDRNVRSGYAHAILLILNSEPELTFSVDELLDQTGTTREKMPSFRSAISRIVKTGQIVRVGQSQYRARPPE